LSYVLLPTFIGINYTHFHCTSGSKLDLLGLGTLVKYGSEILCGFAPKKLMELTAKAGKPIASGSGGGGGGEGGADALGLVKQLTGARVSQELRAQLSDAYEQLASDLVVAHRSFCSKETRMEKDKLIHGSATEQKQQEFDAAKKLYEKLLSITTTLSECMGTDMPVLEVQLINRYIVIAWCALLIISLVFCTLLFFKLLNCFLLLATNQPTNH
jgi:hypothetical protein